MEKNAAGKKVFYVDYTWKELDALDRSRVTLVLPTGATEAHGAHLTMACDSKAAEELALRAAKQVENALVLPALWYSPALDIANYTGTISIKPSNFINYVIDIFEALYRHGFHKLVVANVHGGAKTPLDVAIREFHSRMATRDKGYSDDFFLHLHNFYAPVTGYLNTLAEGKDWGHACEMETSLDLYLYPERVYPERYVEDYIPWEKGFEWYIGDMRAVNKSAIHGDPTKASAEKGEKIANAIIAAFVDILRRL